MRKARRGDEAAFHEMEDRYGAALYRLAFSMVGNAADADDVLQETFMGALKAMYGFEERASVKTWLTRILVRQAARRHRSRGRSKVVASGDPSAEAVARQGADSGVKMDVMAAVDALPPDHREVIVLRELQGMSYEEIADVLAVPRGTVESRLYRARQALRERLRDYLP